MKYFFSISILTLTLLGFSENLDLFDVSFKDSMGKYSSPRRETTFFHQLKKTYEDNHFLRILKTKPKNYQGIPKIIHQIWIGPNKMPNDCIPFMESWVKKHPDWQYKLWTNEDLESFKPFSGNALKNSLNIGCKVDILKYEILYRYGGVYVDVDFESLKPIDIIVENSQFFAAIYERTTIGQGIVGATKAHPLMKSMVQHFKNCENMTFTKPIKETGPRFFTMTIQNYLALPKHEPLLIFPVSFFHSFPRTKRVQFWEEGASAQEIIENFSYPETFAIHYWGHTWAK